MEEEGLYTLIWGPSLWKSLHCITFNYPIEPSEEDKKNYKEFFISLSNVIPCGDCRINFKKHLFDDPETKLSDANLQNRETLTLWIYNIHKKVSERIGITYDMSFEKMKKKYESYIAKNKLSSEERKNAFKSYYDIEAPCLDHKYLIAFIPYAQLRNVRNFRKNIDKYSKLDRNSEEWIERNKKCQIIIEKMRLNGIPCIEEEGEFKGLPTVAEMELMCHASTNICKKDLWRVMKLLEKTYSENFN